MSAQPKPYLTEEAYLATERASLQKHAYIDGEVFALAGGTVAHNLISGNVFAALHAQLRGTGCRVFSSDMRLKVMPSGLNTYPDVMVVCRPFQFVDDRRDTLTNPSVIIEVLSPSTERYDRGMKFQHYRSIATLQEYVLIAQDKHQMEHYVRQANGQWMFEEVPAFTPMLILPSVGGTLTLAEVYDGVEVQPEGPAEDDQR